VWETSRCILEEWEAQELVVASSLQDCSWCWVVQEVGGRKVEVDGCVDPDIARKCHKCSRGAVPSIEVCSAVARIGILAVKPLQTGTSEDVPGPLGCSFKLWRLGLSGGNGSVN
jgi:hypothetical protein